MTAAIIDTSVLLLPRARLEAALTGYDEVAISIATVGEIDHGRLCAGTDWELRFRRDLAHRRMLELFAVLPIDAAGHSPSSRHAKSDFC